MRPTTSRSGVLWMSDACPKTGTFDRKAEKNELLALRRKSLVLVKSSCIFTMMLLSHTYTATAPQHHNVDATVYRGWCATIHAKAKRAKGRAARAVERCKKRFSTSEMTFKLGGKKHFVLSPSRLQHRPCSLRLREKDREQARPCHPLCAVVLCFWQRAVFV